MIATITPQWTAKMYAGKVGRDHLGLGSVSSDQILPMLSPSINVLTYHPRYFSFYVFLLDEFWRRDLTRTSQSWKAFFRPREYIFSVACYLPEHAADKPEHGDLSHIVGGQVTYGHALSDMDAFDTQTNYIKSSLGGYGLYYRTVMAEMELIYPGGRGMPYPVDVPSEQGKAMAAAFRQAIAHTTYYRDYFDNNNTQVPRSVVHEYSNHACICQSQHPQAPDRDGLLQLFLQGGAAQRAAARRDTFRFLLDLIDQTDGSPLNEDIFRQLIYFQAADNDAVYRPQDSVLATFRRWRLYQAREYYAFSLNALWHYLCDWGLSQQGDIHPIPLADVWRHLESALDFDTLAQQCGVPAPQFTAHAGFSDLIAWLRTLLGAPALSLDNPFSIDLPLHEHQLYRHALAHRQQPWAMLAGMVTMLALMQVRFGEPNLWQESAWEIARQGANGRLSMDRFLRRLRHKLTGSDRSIRDITRWIFRDYIILQHQTIASHKLPDNTFRFQREGSRLRFHNLNNSLGFMNSRFEALTTTLHGLGLCGDVSQAEHPLTPDGRTFLAEGELA